MLISTRKVDIYKLPKSDKSHRPVMGAQITIGDLHSNAIKLIFVLVKQGIASNLTKENYKKLVEIYLKKELNKDDLALFDSILDQMIFNPQMKIRLIGDELADRGSNDLLVLKIFKKLHLNKVPLEILLSNHALEFIYACEKQNNFIPAILQAVHANSMHCLNELVEKNVVSREAVLEIVNMAYRPYLKLISYSFSQDGKKMYIYSHALIGLWQIKDIAIRFGCNHLDDLITLKSLTQTIDEINRCFQEHVNKGSVNTLYVQQDVRDQYAQTEKTHSFLDIIWSRRKVWHTAEAPKKLASLKLVFVHGHDYTSRNKCANTINLDNFLGKAHFANKQKYTLIYEKQQYESFDALMASRSMVKTVVEPTKTMVSDEVHDKDEQDKNAPMAQEFLAYMLFAPPQDPHPLASVYATQSSTI